MNNLTPLYSKEPIPPLHQLPHSLRSQDVIGQLGVRTDIFKSSFYPNCISEWNKLDSEIRNVPSIDTFRSKLQSIIRPSLEFMTQKICHIFPPIRVGFSRLNSTNLSTTLRIP